MPVSVTAAPLINVSVSGGVGPAIIVDGSATSVVGVIGVNPFVAGPNISLATSSLGITISAANPPVSSVQSRTGTVVITLADLTGAAAVHTHGTASITGLTAAIVANSPVSSVQSRTGAVVLTLADLTGAAAVHTHSTSDVVGLTTAISANSPVSSVQSRTGAVVLTLADLTGAAAVHTHSTSDVVGLTTIANVVSVNGITGKPTIVAGNGVTVSTSGSNITIESGSGLPSQGGNANRVLATDGTSAVWATRYSIVDPVIVQGDGVTITRDTTSGSITIEAAGGTSGVTLGSGTPQPLGVAASGSSSFASRQDHVHQLPTIADITAAAASHTHLAANVTDLTTVANVVSVNGQTGVVTVTGGSGSTAASVSTKTPSSNPSNNYDAGTTDVVRVDPTTSITLTGLSGGASGVVKLLVNVSTNDVLLSSSNTNSNSTNRFLFTGTERVLGENDSASTFYDATSSRWRLVGHEPAGPPLLWTGVTINTNLNNYSMGTATVLLAYVVGSRQITGFSGGAENRAIRVVNASTNSLTLVHNSNSSDLSNRLLIDTGTDRTLDENDQAELLYDPITMRWRVTPCCGQPSS